MDNHDKMLRLIIFGMFAFCIYLMITPQNIGRYDLLIKAFIVLFLTSLLIYEIPEVPEIILNFLIVVILAFVYLLITGLLNVWSKIKKYLFWR